VRRPEATGEARAAFLALVKEALGDGSFVRLVLARPNTGKASGPRRITVRALDLRGRPGLRFVETHATRDLTHNAGVAKGLAEIDRLVGPVFAHAHLLTASVDAELRRGKRGTWGLSRRAARPAAVAHRVAATDGSAAADADGDVPATAATHDRIKRRHVDIARPWLVDLGVTDADHRLVPAMARKWKQIDKFVEIFDHAIASSALHERASVRVVDFGAGKGYLTFAVHDHLVRALGKRADVSGVELRPDLVELGNRAAAHAGMEGLAFVQGDIRSQAPPAMDVMIALHACDTATDHALHLGVRAGAEVILAAPCCHKELRPQILPPALLKPLLQHGIHLGQQAEMVTDGLRALLLEAEGYATRVFEFVALEHTSKNKMILAVRRPRPLDRDAALAQVRALKDFYGVREQALETLLGESRLASRPVPTT
jgi:hypothetical protein